MTDVKIIKEEPIILRPEMLVKPDAGMSGYCSWVLKDAKTGIIKQEGASKNKITARGLDWIISHIVSGQFPGSSTVEGESSTYHGKVNSTDYIIGTPNNNPFNYLCLLYIYVANNKTATFTEGRGDTSYYIHKCSNPPTLSPSDGITGVDVVTFNELLGDSGTQNGNSHNYSTDPTNRAKILGWKALTSRNVNQSIQSNEDGSILYFKKVSIVFGFAVEEANATTGEGINNIAWANSADCKLVGARLWVDPYIPKTSADTLDITYTFELAVS
jgi:hypothetical protein